ncbi:hypothetical protein BJ912DRAFT_1141031 [Pholiota molesta]|nr:hypothetical protein BJ912DRAFT_1141031 [Pholiota molesta]
MCPTVGGANDGGVNTVQTMVSTGNPLRAMVGAGLLASSNVNGSQMTLRRREARTTAARSSNDGGAHVGTGASPPTALQLNTVFAFLCSLGRLHQSAGTSQPKPPPVEPRSCYAPCSTLPQHDDDDTTGRREKGETRERVTHKPPCMTTRCHVQPLNYPLVRHGPVGIIEFPLLPAMHLVRAHCHITDGAARARTKHLPLALLTQPARPCSAHLSRHAASTDHSPTSATLSVLLVAIWFFANGEKNIELDFSELPLPGLQPEGVIPVVPVDKTLQDRLLPMLFIASYTWTLDINLVIHTLRTSLAGPPAPASTTDSSPSPPLSMAIHTTTSPAPADAGHVETDGILKAQSGACLRP